MKLSFRHILPMLYGKVCLSFLIKDNFFLKLLKSIEILFLMVYTRYIINIYNVIK